MSFGLVAGVGAAVILGGLCIACAALEESNRRKEEELWSRRRRYDDDIRDREQSLAAAARSRERWLREKALKAAISSAVAAESEIYATWQDIKEEVGDLKRQLDAAFKRKNEVRTALRAYKQERIMAANGRYVDFRQDADFQRRLADLRELSSFCQSVVVQKRNCQEAKKGVWKTLEKAKKQRQQAFAALHEYREVS